MEQDNRIGATQAGSDAVLVMGIWVLVSVLVAIAIWLILGWNPSSMWVNVPAMLAGAAAAVWIGWRMKARRETMEAEARLLRHKNKEEETQKQISAMLRKQSRIPKVTR